MTEHAANSSRRWTLHQNDAEFGPYSDAEIQRYIADGTISESSTIWTDGMDEFVPTAQVFPMPPPAAEEFAAAVPQAQPIAYVSRGTARRRRTGLAAYRFRVGHRSFIFQLWLLLWTASYGAWLVSVVASTASHSSGGPSAPPSAPSLSSISPEDAMMGITSGWICFAAGWGSVGLPIGIAAVATLENNSEG